MNEFHYVLAERDMAEAFAGARRRMRRQLLNWRYLAWLGGFLALMVCMSVWMGWVDSTSSSLPVPNQVAVAAPPPPTWKDWAFPLLPWVAIFLFIIFFLRWNLRRIVKNHRMIDRPYTLEVADDGLTWVEPVSRLQYRWAAFYGFKETKNLFLLYLSDPSRAGMLMFHIVPRRAFGSPEAAAEFGRLVRAKIQPQASGFPVLMAKVAQSTTSEN
jgi:hypothetical protein